ncbi:hypothetical protein [Methylorubrum sp. POS3]|uniref:hypothetical protein n=1 Tax=Methylorubrum sp. POS3 TaxID=2998492 RepID=UPI0037265C7E
MDADDDNHPNIEIKTLKGCKMTTIKVKINTDKGINIDMLAGAIGRAINMLEDDKRRGQLEPENGSLLLDLWCFKKIVRNYDSVDRLTQSISPLRYSKFLHELAGLRWGTDDKILESYLSYEADRYLNTCEEAQCLDDSAESYLYLHEYN